MPRRPMRLTTADSQVLTILPTAHPHRRRWHRQCRQRCSKTHNPWQQSLRTITNHALQRLGLQVLTARRRRCAFCGAVPVDDRCGGSAGIARSLRERHRACRSDRTCPYPGASYGWAVHTRSLSARPRRLRERARRPSLGCPRCRSPPVGREQAQRSRPAAVRSRRCRW